MRQAYLEGEIEQLWQRIGAPEPDGLLCRNAQGEILLNFTDQRGAPLVMLAAAHAAAPPEGAALPHMGWHGDEQAGFMGFAGDAGRVLAWMLQPQRDFSQELRHLVESALAYAALLRQGLTDTPEFQQLHALLRPAGAPFQNLLAMMPHV